MRYGAYLHPIFVEYNRLAAAPVGVWIYGIFVGVGMTHMTHIVAIFALIGVPGLAFGQSSFVGPSGQAMHTSKCQGGPGDCYQEAAQTCGGSYQIRDSESHAGGLLVDILPGPVTWYEITYTCGASDGRLAQFPRRGPEPNYGSAPAYGGPSQTNCIRAGDATYCNHH